VAASADGGRHGAFAGAACAQIQADLHFITAAGAGSAVALFAMAVSAAAGFGGIAAAPWHRWVFAALSLCAIPVVIWVVSGVVAAAAAGLRVGAMAVFRAAARGCRPPIARRRCQAGFCRRG
jgi:hypothetical protein